MDFIHSIACMLIFLILFILQGVSQVSNIKYEVMKGILHYLVKDILFTNKLFK